MTPEYLSKKHKDKIWHWDDERSIGNAIIVSLKNGHAFNPSEKEHVRGFDTIAEAIEGVKNATTCECEDCRAG